MLLLSASQMVCLALLLIRARVPSSIRGDDAAIASYITSNYAVCEADERKQATSDAYLVCLCLTSGRRKVQSCGPLDTLQRLGCVNETTPLEQPWRRLSQTATTPSTEYVTTTTMTATTASSTTASPPAADPHQTEGKTGSPLSLLVFVFSNCQASQSLSLTHTLFIFTDPCCEEGSGNEAPLPIDEVRLHNL